MERKKIDSLFETLEEFLGAADGNPVSVMMALRKFYTISVMMSTNEIEFGVFASGVQWAMLMVLDALRNFPEAVREIPQKGTIQTDHGEWTIPLALGLLDEYLESKTKNEIFDSDNPQKVKIRRSVMNKVEKMDKKGGE